MGVGFPTEKKSLTGAPQPSSFDMFGFEMWGRVGVLINGNYIIYYIYYTNYILYSISKLRSMVELCNVNLYLHLFHLKQFTVGMIVVGLLMMILSQ